MVFYFTLACNPNVVCYMGRDKHENEDLIRWGWPEDLWFHVDSLSSAHVYVRLPKGTQIDDMTAEMVEECCQLVKANSIQGCKQNDVRIVYTPWANLKKTGDMDVGQIGYHDPKNCRYHTVARKNNDMLRKLERTRVEKEHVDFRAEREERDRRDSRQQRAEEKARQEEERRMAEERRKMEDQKNYVALMDEDKMTGPPPEEDDFM